MSTAARCAALLAIGAVVLTATGCGETVIDSAKAEEALQSNLEKSLHEKITSVDCPSNQKVEAGKTFTCEVVFSHGKRATATLKIRDKEADVSLVGFDQNK